MNKCIVCDFEQNEETCVAVKPRINKYNGLMLCDRCIDYLDGHTVWDEAHCYRRGVGRTPKEQLNILKNAFKIQPIRR